MKDENESLHTTKEVLNLDELTESAINSIEEIVDENMAEADLQFQEEIEQLHMPDDTMILEPEEKKKDKKENIFKKLKNKWSKLSKKNKIIIIIVSIIVLILIGVGVFFLTRKKEAPKQDVPDVILEEDNYRYENGILHFLDDEEELGTYECTNKDENKCFVAYLTNDDEFDGLKKINDDGEEINIRSKIYNERFVFVFDNKSENDDIIKLYDMKDNEVKEEFLLVKAYDFIEDAVILKNMDNKYGLVTFNDDEAKTTINYDYDYLGVLEDDKDLERLVAKKDGSFYLVNKNNETLTNAMSDPIVGANKEHLKIKNVENQYTVLDYHGKEVGKGDFALLLDKYVIFAREMQLYVTDYEKHPMNLDGIAIKNNTFNPIATYKKNKLVKTEKSFDAEIYDKNLILTIYEDDTDDLETVTLNLTDGEFSKNLAFMNYLNGKLYFYSDEKKENLLGSYVCNNKNNVESNNASLNNCTIANESLLTENTANEKEKHNNDELGLLPVFYNRYIFIRDGNESIVLYDLKEGSTKAWYTKVDAKIYNKADKLNNVDNGPFYYIAQSERSGSYGLAKITANSVDVQLEFKYNSLKRLGDYYVIETDGSYFLADIGGRVLTTAKNGPIVDYNHNNLKYIKDNKYYVSAFDKDSDGNGYEYIELYDNYYAAVSRNEKDKKAYLSIFKYNAEEAVNNTAENILLNIDKYYGDGVKAFNITFDNKNIIVEVAKNDHEYDSKKIIIDTTEAYVKPKEEEKEDEESTPVNTEKPQDEEEN